MGCGCKARRPGFAGGGRQLWYPGRRCCIVMGSGLDSGKCGTIVNKALVRTDGRGVPREIEGAYQPLNKNEIVLRLDNGRLVAEYKNRLLCSGR